MTAAAPFRRGSFASGETAAVIGPGAIGGKAEGLLRARVVAEGVSPPSGIRVDVPAFVVVGAGAFRSFVDRNRLREAAGRDDRAVAAAFLRGELPPEIVGDLWDLAREAHAPLAVRSSGVLEDAAQRPFAGVYLTKMLANGSLEAARRFERMVEAVKLVWASTYFARAAAHRRSAGRADDEDAMAVIVQEVVGRRVGDIFFPHVSGVARTVNYYPSPPGRPEDGVADLALGLGKTIVEGGRVWTYSPAHPRAPAPFGDAASRLDHSQRDFWAVHMGRRPWDPAAETEYLVRLPIGDVEASGTLDLLASTYDAQGDRLVPGVRGAGPRLLDFALLLSGREFVFNDALRQVMARARAALGTEVEVEFAASLPAARDGVLRLGLVQLRPLGGAGVEVEVPEEALESPHVRVASTRVVGQGEREDLLDVVWVDAEAFEPRRSAEAAREVASHDAALRAAGRPYLLLGFGRWGSSDPWLGIPVAWDEVSGAAVIVEATRPGFDVEPSQGAHFFHNLVAAGTLYLCVPHQGPGRVDWEWLKALAGPGAPPRLVRHAVLPRPLVARVNARLGRGVVLAP